MWWLRWKLFMNSSTIIEINKEYKRDFVDLNLNSKHDANDTWIVVDDWKNSKEMIEETREIFNFKQYHDICMKLMKNSKAFGRTKNFIWWILTKTLHYTKSFNFINSPIVKLGNVSLKFRYNTLQQSKTDNNECTSCLI